MYQKLNFGRWTIWEKRNDIENNRSPGIYIIAITNKDLENRKFRWEDVSYIGMTHAKNGLCGRWNQFDQAIKGNGGHSGGNTIERKLGNYEKWKKKSHLYVCCMAIKCNVDKGTRKADDLIKMGAIAFLEYRALAQFKKATGREPEYNTR